MAGEVAGDDGSTGCRQRWQSAEGSGWMEGFVVSSK